MLRLEGLLSDSPAAFIDHFPAGNITILPFGTSFVIHVPPTDFDLIRDFVADQGNNILLVGATGETAAGLEVGSGLRACGGNVLADRFPTPQIAAKTTGSDRKSVVSGKSVSVRVDLGGRRILQKTTHLSTALVKNNTTPHQHC